MNIMIWSLLLSFILVIVVMPFIIKYFKEKQLGQVTREEGPSWHQTKSGTPTMGGVGFIFVTFLTVSILSIFRSELDFNLWLLTITFILYGSIGFIDDYIKLVMKRNLGLTSRQKFIAQIIIGIIFYIFLLTNGFDNQLSLPIIGSISLSYFYGFFAVFWLVGFSNATNLTDGIDGLMASTGIVAYSAYTYLAFVQEKWGIVIFTTSVIGGLLGFLVFNKKPAKIFMGDVGSLALGGGLAAISIMLHAEWSLLTIGIIFVVETASVILQVASFQLFGKRIFKMSPIHHHFEMIGWSEWKIVILFTLTSVIGMLVTLKMI